MTTDEMILALVATGKFTLPSNIRCDDSMGWVLAKEVALSQSKAHDLCAMHFAREACRSGAWGYELSAALCAGDSAAAIKALYEAMKERG